MSHHTTVQRVIQEGRVHRLEVTILLTITYQDHHREFVILLKTTNRDHHQEEHLQSKTEETMICIGMRCCHIGEEAPVHR